MAVDGYGPFDHREVTAFLFHPRKEGAEPPPRGEWADLAIPVEGNAVIGGRLFRAGADDPVILYFHGNGEIVEDYNDLGPLYAGLGINFLPVDYRGYGRSTGNPTVSAMMGDCRTIFEYVLNWLPDAGIAAPLVVMGRSLGSASALEIADRYPERIAGLIIESGFALAVPLLRLLGINTERLGLREEGGFGNVGKIRRFTGPLLVIHAEYDHIIPFSDGEMLFDACPSKDKVFLRIPEANHNTIFSYGLREYLSAVKEFAGRVKFK